MTVIKAAAVQISPVLYSREGTVDRVVNKIIELGRQGVRFATFPETVVPYYPYYSFVLRPFEIHAENLRLLEQAVTVPSTATRAIGDACRQAGMVVAIGVSERTLQRATQSALGMPPIRFVQEARLEQATFLLRTTNQTPAAVALAVGYQDVSTLRTLIRRRRHTTLAALRGI